MTAGVNKTDEQYNKQLQQKSSRLQSMFSEFRTPELEILTSAANNYRLRVEFRVWHEGEDLYYIMFDQDSKEKYRVSNFPCASLMINKLMPALIDELKPDPILRRKLYQVDFLSTLSGQVLVSLIYHRKLDEGWENAVIAMKKRLSENFHVQFIGRARKQKITMDQDYVIENLCVDDKKFRYMQLENSFTQPNGGVNQKMLSWANRVTQKSKGDLLELYCGNGNFSVALAKNFNRVLATEIAKASVFAAHYNIKINNIENTKIIRMSAADFIQAIKGVRPFYRLKQADIDLSDYNFGTILVDPPRAGLDSETMEFVQNFDNVIYISCNPETLKSNIKILKNSHKIIHFAFFDQFPFTRHIETGLFLQKNQ